MLECRDLTVAPGGRPVIQGLDLALEAGTLTALVGPSGAGKTTLLRALAGLETRISGSIALAARDLGGVPPHKRGVALVFQEPRLLPNMNVAENVAFPLRIAGVAKKQRARRAGALLGEVGLAGLAQRGTRGLSGGEAQRVALARALCASPELLLLDEPLGAVDPNRRRELRTLIERVQRERGITTLLVTHDRAEAAELGQTLALMIDGRIVQHDEPRALFERPASPVVARFFGAHNLLQGTVRAGRLRLGEVELELSGADGPAAVAIRPEHVVVGRGDLRMRVEATVYLGAHVRLSLVGEGLELEAHVPPDTPGGVGAIVRVELPPDRLWRFPDPLPEPARVPAPQRG